VTAETAERRGRRHESAVDAWWVEVTRRVALVVFPVLIALGVVAPALTGRLVWTVAIAALPLFIVVVGYHRWRRICPLAFIAQMPTRLGRAGRRRAGRWMQAHAYHLVFGIFVVSLWLRLVATNGNGLAIAVFLMALAAAAVGVGLVYTGKTWCNYVCPVSFVEKLYTEPRGLRETANSQCATCTACRPACPDINQENSYWKEILQPAKRHIFYAFPGVVLAFYGYYYLQSGTWAYYFDGSWTNEPDVMLTAFRPGVSAATAGLFFGPAVPRAVASAATLIAGGVSSLFLFSVIERLLGPSLVRRGLARDEAALRSVMFTLAAFAAFISFYAFAGAPTLRLVPGLPYAMQVAVVGVATLSLARRIGRRQDTFAEETLARRIIANWQWTDTPPQRDLREAFLIHTIRSQTHAESQGQLVSLYKNAVRDALESGVVSRADVHRLASLRDQLHVSDADHERVMAELADEGCGVDRGTSVPLSPEKQLQLETYAGALAVHLERQRAAGAAVDDTFIRDLRAQYGVTADEHAAELERLIQSREGIAAYVADAPAAIEMAAMTVARLSSARSPIARFLVALLGRRWQRAADSLLQAVAGQESGQGNLRPRLLSDDARDRTDAVSALGTRLSESMTAQLLEAQDRARRQITTLGDLAEVVRLQLPSPDPYVRATALYFLESIDAATETDHQALADDEHPVVRATVESWRAARTGEMGGESSVIAKMVALKSVTILSDLEPEELAQLARASTESWFTEGEVLCREGELGDDVFVLLDGEVSILRRTNGADEVVAVEGPGSCIGELAVLDPAPRGATVMASTIAVRALRLGGAAFRAAVHASPRVSESVIRMLVRRLRENPAGRSART
jgi:hypothetical protein